MPRVLFDPRMLATMGEFFPSTCAIQEPPTTRDAYGQIVETVDDDWASVAGLESIPCQIAALSASERQRLTGPVATATHRIALRGVYGTITPKMRAEIGGEYWGVLGTAADSQSTYTRLLVEQVKV
jgi:head-tail adaptor